MSYTGAPGRWFGPLDNKAAADDLVEAMLDDASLRETLKAFLAGDIETRELCYEIQVVAENVEARMKGRVGA